MKALLNTHAHFDQAGGLRAPQAAGYLRCIDEQEKRFREALAKKR